jgi:hypothetical protein
VSRFLRAGSSTACVIVAPLILGAGPTTFDLAVNRVDDALHPPTRIHRLGDGSCSIATSRSARADRQGEEVDVTDASRRGKSMRARQRVNQSMMSVTGKSASSRAATQPARTSR